MIYLAWVPIPKIFFKEMTVWKMVAFSLFLRLRLFLCPYIQSNENHNFALCVGNLSQVLLF